MYCGNRSNGLGFALPVAAGAVPGVVRTATRTISRVTGISEQRLRSPAANRAARVQQIAEAVAMARSGNILGVRLLYQWAGRLPNHSVSDPSYRGGTPQGRMPADGVAGAEAAISALLRDGVITADGTFANRTSSGAVTAKPGAMGGMGLPLLALAGFFLFRR